MGRDGAGCACSTPSATKMGTAPYCIASYSRRVVSVSPRSASTKSERLTIAAAEYLPEQRVAWGGARQAGPPKPRPQLASCAHSLLWGRLTLTAGSRGPAMAHACMHA